MIFSEKHQGPWRYLTSEAHRRKAAAPGVRLQQEAALSALLKRFSDCNEGGPGILISSKESGERRCLHPLRRTTVHPLKRWQEN